MARVEKPCFDVSFTIVTFPICEGCTPNRNNGLLLVFAVRISYFQQRVDAFRSNVAQRAGGFPVSQAPDEMVVDQRIRTMQIIIGALVGGVLSFAVIAFVVRSSMPEASGTRIISIMAIVVALVCAVASLIVPKSIAA